MKQFFSAMCLILCIGYVHAQQPQPKATTPQETEHEQRRTEREQKMKEYCIYMDSLIRSQVYSFKPYSMQMQPAGRMQQLSNPSFRMDVKEDYIDIYLPFVAGFLPPYRMTILNYTLGNVPEYKSVQSDDGQEWTITFSSSLYSSDTYKFKMTVTTCTGDALLEISSNQNNTVSYSGTLRQFY